VTRRAFLALAFWRRRRIRLAGVQFRIVRRGKSNRRYIHIHGNEETARQVLTAHMRIYPGIAYMVEGPMRNAPILGGILDPNRMFSRAGARRNLAQLNPTWGEAQMGRALDELDRGRDKLVRALLPPSGGRLVALHNNSEGYSVRDEVAISDRTSLKEPDNPHAFFLCTSPKDFEILARSPYNVLLQVNGPTEDDGSLSRLAARVGARYVNLEVGLGNAARQREMIEWLERNLP
jgi:hypothetical protein